MNYDYIDQLYQLKDYTSKYKSFWSIWMSGQFMPGAANLCLEAVEPPSAGLWSVHKLFKSGFELAPLLI